MHHLKLLLKRLSFHVHKLALRAGIFVLPVHYYASLSNVLELEHTRAEWAGKSQLLGLKTTLDEQAAHLRRICMPFETEYAGNPAYNRAVSTRSGPGYGYIEAQALHGVVRSYKPRQIIEVGSGVSSFCMVEALGKNRRETGTPAQLTCIEPHPSKPLRKLEQVDLIQSKVQRVPLSVFQRLEAGDLLFIDSSHTVRPGSDVVYLISEVLPRLASGVLLHFHDIFFPYSYQRDVLETYFQWMETPLLQAFLAFNSKFSVVFCLSQLHYEQPEVLKEVFPEYLPAPGENGLAVTGTSPDHHYPSSIYIETQ